MRISTATLATALALPAFVAAWPGAAAEKNEAPTYAGAAVTVVKAKRSCFSDAISVSGMIVAREEVPVRPDKEGYQITQVMVDPGETVKSGQALARLTPPDSMTNASPINVTAPVGGIVLKSDAVIGTTASSHAPPMFTLIGNGEFELQGELPVKQLAKLSAGQEARIAVMGAGGLVRGRVRMLAPMVDGGTQLGQVRIYIGNDSRLRVGGFGRAQIVIAQSCNVSIPLSAVLYGSDTAVTAVVRNNRVETRQIVVGQLAGGEAEVSQGLSEGDLVVAKAGAFFREGDRVRPFLDGALVK